MNLSPDPTIRVGDGVSAQVYLTSILTNGSQVWAFNFTDNATGSAWSGSAVCGAPTCDLSTFSGGEWIEGVPAGNPTPSLMPAFEQFVWDSYGVYNASPGVGWATYSNYVTVFLRNLSVSSGDLVASTGYGAGPYGGNYGFAFYYLIDEYDSIIGGQCCVLSPNVTSYGTLVAATMKLSTWNGFQAGPVTTLGLELELVGNNRTCFDPQNALVGFAPNPGYGYYTTHLKVCPGLPGGKYHVQLLIYYVPVGGMPGSPGGLLLVATGFRFPDITLAHFSVSSLQLLPASGTVDVGQQVVLSATVLPLGSSPGPYRFLFTGAPPGCSNGIDSASPSVNDTCYPSASGRFSIIVQVQGPGGSTNASAGSVSLVVYSDPQVTLNAGRKGLDMGMAIDFQANATGGAPGGYTYTWDGLPLGCDGVNLSVLHCRPLLFGTYAVTVNVTDSLGATSKSSAAEVLVSLPLVVVLLANYSQVPVGFTVRFLGGLGGGLPPYALTWTGLPPGCVARNSTNLSCAPTGPGQFFVRLSATDANGASNYSTVELNVTAVPWFSAIWIYSLIAVAGAVACATTVVIVRRRRRRRGAGTPPPPPQQG